MSNDNVHVNVPTTVPGMSPDYTHPKFQKYMQEAVEKSTREALNATLDYPQVLRSFDHEELAASPSYQALRLALSCVANESGKTDPMLTLGGFLDAVRDMAATSLYGNMCDDCVKACLKAGHEHGEDEFPRPCGAYRTTWPYGGERRGDRMICWYTCENGHGCEVSWAADFREWT